MANVIELSDIKKSYRTGGEETPALRGISFSVRQGEFLAIMGHSGSGKSSLMNILGLLDVPTSGRYLLNGVDMAKLSKNRQAEIRNQEIGFVFQQFNLLPRTTVWENVLLPTIYGSSKGAPERAKQLLGQVGLSDRLKHRSNQLSGGQIQRVAIARALIMNPTLILADEPTGNLDTKTSMEIMRLLSEINGRGATIVLITHEEDIAQFADRTIRIQDGLVIKTA